MACGALSELKELAWDRIESWQVAESNIGLYSLWPKINDDDDDNVKFHKKKKKLSKPKSNIHRQFYTGVQYFTILYMGKLVN